MCTKNATWEVFTEKNPYGSTYGCDEHIGVLLGDGPHTLYPFEGKAECCFLEQTPGAHLMKTKGVTVLSNTVGV